MVEKIFIDAFVHGTVGVEKVHVLAKPHGVRKGMYEIFNHFFLLRAQAEGVPGIHGREISCLKMVGDAVQRDRIVVPVDLS